MAFCAGFIFLLAACGQYALTPRQAVVRDAMKAVCDQRSFSAMGPYLTETSKPMIELITSMAELGKIMGENPADKIAIECQSGGGAEFFDEIRVTDSRYIVRLRNKGSHEITEYIVIQESGSWKIELTGK